MKTKCLNIYTLIILSFTSFNFLSAQLQIGDTSPNFTAPVCANSDEGTFDLYQNANGNVNGGEYKVVWLNLFTSW